MDIGEKVSLLRTKYSDGNNLKFAELMEESPGTTSNWCKAKSLGREVLVKILSKLPDVNANWLLMDNGSMLKSEQISSIQQRLEHFIEAEGINIMDFCKMLGLPLPQFRALNGNISEHRLKMIIENYPQLSIEWLMAGNGKMIKSDIQDVQTLAENSSEVEELKAEIIALKAENKVLRELAGLGERKDNSKSA